LCRPTIIERHSKINFYFQCTVVSLNLEYLNMVAFKMTLLHPIKNWTFWYMERLFASAHAGTINC